MPVKKTAKMADNKKVHPIVDARIDSKKVFQFMRNLRGAEAKFTLNLISTSLNVQCFITKHKIPKKLFCEKVGIKPNQYKDFVLGSFNYSIEHLVKIGCFQNELEKGDELEKTIDGWISIAKDSKE